MIKSGHLSLAGALRRGGMAVPVLALALAACAPGSAGGRPAADAAGSASVGSAAAGSSHGATFHGTFYVRAQEHNKPTAWHVTRTFTQRVRSVPNCAAAARSGMSAGAFRVPSPSAPQPRARIQVTRFRGPGTYPPQVMKHDKSDTIFLGHAAGIRSGAYVITTSAPGAAQGEEVLFLNTDGSGQLVYSGAHLNGQAGSPAVAGLISWSCTS